VYQGLPTQSYGGSLLNESMYQSRSYRHWIKGDDLVSFNVTVKETDLYIRAGTNLSHQAHHLVLKYRQTLEEYLLIHPHFLASMKPLPIDDDAPAIVKDMLAAAQKAGVGPMAAVAGAIAESVGAELVPYSANVIVENGGDIYMKSRRKRTIGIYAGTSPLSGKLRLEIAGRDTPLGVCTSSGTVGHSISFGMADAVVALSPSAALADAAATAIGNIVKTQADIPNGLELAQNIDGLRGVLIIAGDQTGIWGGVKLC